LTSTDGPRHPRSLRAGATALAAVLLCLVLLGWALGALLVPLFHDADAAALGWVRSHEGGRLVAVMGVLTWLGSGVTLTVAGIPLAAALLYRGRRAEVVLIAVSSLGAAVVVQAVKLAVGRVRPLDGLVHAAGASFPSGHAGEALGFHGAVAVVILLSTRRSGVRITTVVVAVLVVLTVCLSRVALGVHYPSDVLGSLILCGIWLAVTARLVSPPPSRHPRR
jgi:undecaprenyl-diphosphatase